MRWIPIMLLLGCGASQDLNGWPIVEPTPPHEVEVIDGDPHLKVWVAPHYFVSPEVVMDGCAMWADQGVGCELVERWQDATTLVNVDDRACTREEGLVKGKGEDTIYTLGWATKEGAIRLFPACLYRSGEYATYWRLTANVAAHEFGHVMGIPHVPKKCDAPLTCCGGMTLCGKAIMNPLVNTGLTGITATDRLMFEHRHHLDTPAVMEVYE